MRQHFCSERDADMLSVRIKVLDGFDFARRLLEVHSVREAALVALA